MKRIDFVLINLQGNAEKVFSAALSLIVLHFNPIINLDISNMKAIININGKHNHLRTMKFYFIFYMSYMHYAFPGFIAFAYQTVDIIG